MGWKADFLILSSEMNGKPLVFLDSAASAQKPSVVIDFLSRKTKTKYANIHRGLYNYSQVTTEEFEAVRGQVSAFIGAKTDKEIVFTRNATEAINLVAASWGGAHLKDGDEIVLSEMEHHANIIPWKLLQERIAFKIKVIPVKDNGELDMAAYKELLSARTKLVSVTHVSNTLGTVNNVKEINSIAKKVNPDIKVLIDGSQSVVHMAVDVQALDCDFFVFTGHKLYGPTGVGVLYGKYDVLNAMPPYQGGGDMIDFVSFEKVTFQPPPSRFEAGTPAILEVLALGAAITYVSSIGMDKIKAHEADVLSYGMRSLQDIDGLILYGMAPQKAGILSFRLDGINEADIAHVLDQMGIAVRTGHHCCMPLMTRLGIDGTVRASLAMYSEKEDIDRLVEGIRKAKDLLG